MCWSTTGTLWDRNAVCVNIGVYMNVSSVYSWSAILRRYFSVDIKIFSAKNRISYAAGSNLSPEIQYINVYRYTSWSLN
jgi:hypothetical protein